MGNGGKLSQKTSTGVDWYTCKRFVPTGQAIMVSHTFELPDGGAEIGDKVRTSFVLVGERTFSHSRFALLSNEIVSWLEGVLFAFKVCSTV